MSESSSTVASALAQLRQVWMARIPDELQRLCSLAEALRPGAQAGKVLEPLHQGLHKIAGSAGTFHFPELGRQARELETVVKGWITHGRIEAAELMAWHEGVASLEGLFLKEQDEGDAVAPQPTLSATPSTCVLAGKQALWVVEDDPLQGQELQRQFEQYGYQVTLFQRFAEAELAARGSPPDALVLDVHFHQEGITLTDRAVQASPLFAGRLPLFVISANDDFEARMAAVRLGAVAYLTKPVNVQKLVERMELALECSPGNPYRVLIVDDDDALASHFVLVLEEAGMAARRVEQAQGIIDELADFRPDLVLMDLQMPDYSGPELAALIRTYEEWLSLPIVYLSAETDLDQRISAMGRGGDDYLIKPISDHHLVAAVSHRVARSRKLADLMTLDGLTGLLKHARIKEELALACSRAERSRSPLSVVMCDIDHFKRVNDSWGHATGDQVIHAMAQMLKRRLRKSDVIGRYGGEEFLILLPECGIEQARSLMEDVRSHFAELHFRHGESTFSVTLSAGIAAWQPGVALQALLERADQALYRAKEGGRNQVRIDHAE